jgi:outer membrane lipoprotein-sorting protein
MKKLILILAIFSFSILIAQTLSKSQVFDKIKEKYGDVNSIYFEFSFVNNPNLKGEVRAERGNKYVMFFNGRTITSNGALLWNYSEQNNNVIISNFETMESEVSLESFFFDFLDKYEAEKLVKNTSTEFSNDYGLSLVPADENNYVMNIERVILYFDKSDYDIDRVRLFNNGSIEDWILTNQKINPEYSESIFNFMVPDSTQEIDLR